MIFAFFFRVFRVFRGSFLLILHSSGVNNLAKFNLIFPKNVRPGISSKASNGRLRSEIQVCIERGASEVDEVLLRLDPPVGAPMRSHD